MCKFDSISRKLCIPSSELPNIQLFHAGWIVGNLSSATLPQNLNMQKSYKTHHCEGKLKNKNNTILEAVTVREPVTVRERSQMTWSNFLKFVVFRPLHPPPFPKMIFGEIIFYGKIYKLLNQDLAMNFIQNKNQSNCSWLNVLDIK